jgi:acyl-CoA reductase-like NAD-dependent aldehyde dehydrogenase
MFDPKVKLKTLKIENRFFIDGKFLTTQNTILKTSSINNYKLPNLYVCLEDEVNLAVSTAYQAYQNGIWKKKSLEEKKQILYKLADLIEKSKDDLSLIDTIETGRSIKNFYFDSIPKAVEGIRWFSEAVDKYFDHAITPTNNQLTSIVKQPLGVVGIITPWNDPLVVNFWKITPALLMGNSVVVKPAEQASFSMLKIASLAKEAGIPDGVLNIITGDGRTGKLLALHNDIRGIFFTGSSEVGKLILQYSGQSNMKKVGLECGGKSPFVVTKNSNNLQKAAKILAKNIFYNQGQICSAPSRLIIDKEIKDIFLNYLIDESQNYIPSDPLDFDTNVGKVINQAQKERIESYINYANQESIKTIIISDNKDSMSFSPTIFDEVSPNSKLAQDEIFGPTLVVIVYESLDEAISIANNTKYGLAAAVFSDDINEANKLALAIEAGLVHINTYDAETYQMPFGGVKESGLGRDKSILVFDEYSELKTIITQLDFE